MAKNFITICRSIKRHWLWEKPQWVKWWLDLLLSAAWEDKKVFFRGSMVDVKRGQLVTSMPYLAVSWGVSEKVVRGYIKRLVDTDTIRADARAKSWTLVTISNYDCYQLRGADNGVDMGDIRKAKQGALSGALKGVDVIYKEDNNNNNNNNKENTPKGVLKKEKYSFDFFGNLISLGVETQVAKDWMEVRKKKKSANTATAFERLKAEVAKTGLTMNACIRVAVERSWSGFYAEWLQNATHKEPQKNNFFRNDSVEVYTNEI